MYVCIIIKTVSNPAFFFLLRTSHGTLHTLKQHLNENGLTPRHRRKAPRTNKKFVTSEDIKSVLTFITNYAEVHGRSCRSKWVKLYILFKLLLFYSV